MINKPPLLKGLQVGIPIIIPIGEQIMVTPKMVPLIDGLRNLSKG